MFFLFGCQTFRIVAPTLNQFGHVGRDFAVEVHLLIGDGVHETERLGVKRLAWTHLKAVVNELRVVARCVASQHFVAAVAGIVEKRVTDMLHVHTNLVGAARFELASHHSHMREVFERMVVGDGVLAVLTIGEHAHLQTVAEAASHMSGDSTVHLLHRAPHHSHILSLGGFVEKLLAERGLGIWRFSHHQQPGGVFIDAVNEPHSWVGHIVIGIVLEVPCKGVDQRAIVIAVAWVHAHAGRLVHHQQGIVFLHDVDGDVLCYNLIFVAWAVHHHGDDFAGVHAVVRLHGLAVHANTLRFGCVLNTVSRSALDALHKVFVDTQKHLPFFYLKAVVFPVVCAIFAEIGVAEILLDFGMATDVKIFYIGKFFCHIIV